MNKKQFLRLTAFLLCVASVIVIMCGLFEYPNSHMSERIKTFDKFKKNTVDAIYVGTSGVDRFWIAAKAFDDYGMTVYPLSFEALPSWAVVDVIKEGLSKQNSSLVIIDARSFCWDPSTSASVAEKRSRRVIDQFSLFSINRLELIEKSSDLIHEINPEFSRHNMTLYLPFIKYHTMWSDDTFSFAEIGRTESKTLGYRLYKGKSIKTVAQENPCVTDEIKELNKYSKSHLEDTVSYIKENNINAVFVASPKINNEEAAMNFNYIFDYLESEGIPYIDFNSRDNIEKYKIDYSHDFYDEGHVNIYGALKYTDYLSAYLSENYDLPDHRDDEKCEEWHGVYEYIMTNVEKWEKAKKNK